MQLQFLLAGEGQHSLRQRRAAFGRGHRIVEIAADIRAVRHALAGKVEAADDDGEQIVEIMGDAAGQLADRVHLLRLDDGVTRGVERLLRFAPFGQVAGDLGKTEQLALGIANAVDDDIGPEARSILANAPSFGFEPAIAFGGMERARGQPRHPILFRIEAGEILA